MLGIIGGVGPLATSRYCQFLDNKIAATHKKPLDIIVHTLPMDAEIENAFIQGYEYVDTEIYMRTRLLMVQALEKFRRDNVQTIAMPCNTLQPLLEEVCAHEHVHNINLIQETSKRVSQQHIEHVLIIGTNETCRSNIYGDTLQSAGIRHKYLGDDDQHIVAQHISTSLRAPQEESPYLESFITCIRRASHDVDGLVIACTDLAGNILSERLKIPVIDSLQALVDSSAEYILRERNDTSQFP